MKQTLHKVKRTITKTFALVLAGSFLMNQTGAQVCSNLNNIYGLTSNGGIYPISITNANVGSQLNSGSLVSGTANQANAIGYNSANGLFYFFRINPGTGSQQFVSYNPTLNLDITLTNSPTSATVHAGCVSLNGTGYFCDDVNGVLYYYDIALNTWTTITSDIIDQYGDNVSTLIQTQNSGDMAIDGLGNLWIVTSSSSNYGLYKLPTPLPTTAQGSVTVKQLIAPTSVTPSSNSFEGIAFTAAGQIMLSTSDNKLYNLKNTSTLSYIGTFSVTGVGNDLTSCSYPTSILPLVWESIDATLEGSQVNINWTVGDVENVNGFAVERSQDNVNWVQVSYLPYNVNSSDYTSTDPSPSPGNNYYRIKEEDENGNSSYSAIKMISITPVSGVSVWPNPAVDQINVENKSESIVQSQLFDQMGRRIAVNTIYPGNNGINISNFARGAYILRIQNEDGTVETEKIIKK